MSEGKLLLVYLLFLFSLKTREADEAFYKPKITASIDNFGLTAHLCVCICMCLSEGGHGGASLLIRAFSFSLNAAHTPSLND